MAQRFYRLTFWLQVSPCPDWRSSVFRHVTSEAHVRIAREQKLRVPSQLEARMDRVALRRQVSMAEILRHWGYRDCLHGAGPQRRGPCPLHDAPGDRRRSFSVHLTTGVFRCFHPACRAQGKTLDLWAAYHRLDINSAARRMTEILAPDLTPLSNTDTEKRNP